MEYIANRSPEHRGEVVVSRKRGPLSKRFEVLDGSASLSAYIYGTLSSGGSRVVDLVTQMEDTTRVSVSFPEDFILEVAALIQKQRLRDHRDREGARTGIDLDKSHGDEDGPKRPTNDTTSEEFEGLQALFG